MKIARPLLIAFVCLSAFTSASEISFAQFPPPDVSPNGEFTPGVALLLPVDSGELVMPEEAPIEPGVLAVPTKRLGPSQVHSNLGIQHLVAGHEFLSGDGPKSFIIAPCATPFFESHLLPPGRSNVPDEWTHENQNSELLSKGVHRFTLQADSQIGLGPMLQGVNRPFSETHLPYVPYDVRMNGSKGLDTCRQAEANMNLLGRTHVASRLRGVNTTPPFDIDWLIYQMPLPKTPSLSDGSFADAQDEFRPLNRVTQPRLTNV